jgi:diadenylate cyclase
LHDGAVIIKNDTIIAAGCFLPLSDTDMIKKEYGTRHRAALGISEESDAVVVVVSEETGKISLSYDGKLYTNYEIDILKKELANLLGYEADSDNEELLDGNV